MSAICRWWISVVEDMEGEILELEKSKYALKGA